MGKITRAKAVIITIGDEILIGQTLDTNAAWLSSQLHQRGIEVLRMLTVSDEEEEMERAIRESLKVAGLVVCTGGLGPTRDDKTKEVLCKVSDEKLVFSQEVFDWISERKRQQGKEPNELHRRQSYMPTGFDYFRNNRGTAPGMLGEIDDSIIVSLPGVPYEMKELMTNQIIPVLLEKLPVEIAAVRTLLTAGVAESELAQELSDLEDNLPEGLSLAWLPGHTRVRIRLTSRGDDRQTVEQNLDECTVRVREILGDIVYGEGDDSLEEVVFELLKNKQLSLAVAESCTGGFIAHLITLVPGVSACFKGGVVAYSNEIKREILDVNEQTLKEHGAVSAETVREMLTGVCEKFGTDTGIAVSGIAGPDGGTPEKPVGTVWVAVGGVEKQHVEKLRLNLNRKLNIEKSGLLALNMLRLFLSRD
ncbi:MAG: competence/damage-inducible protein A [Saprospirales bacterium]|nr:MAG: competence/damage-inducible protein A [Saprospirales bacterium]